MNFDKIPEELKQLPRWVCWKLEERKGKLTKIPVNPHPRRDGTYGQAMSNNTETWGSYTAALRCLDDDKSLAGVGFMLGDGYVGVDIDDCDEDGKMADHARDIVGTLDSFTEWSPSGQGLHVICRGKLPEGRRQVFIEREGHPDAHLGIYDERRFFCMTGNVLDDAHMVVEDRQEGLMAMYEKYINVKKSGKSVIKTSKNVIKTGENVIESPTFASDDDIIEVALKAKNGDSFAMLMDGNWKGTYTSQSEADLALCNLLAFYTGSDPIRMDRLFRRSGLYREKWDEGRGSGSSYGELTIQKAIADCNNAYTPPDPEKKKRKKKQQPPPEIETGLDQLVSKPVPPDNALPEWITGPYHDTWNAQRLVEKYGKDIRYNTNKGWHIWNGKYWEEDRQEKVRRMADETISGFYKYEPAMALRYGYEGKRYKEFVGWLAKARNTGRKDNMIREAQGWEGISTLPDDFDKDLWLINCQNGTIDLRTGQLRSHDQKDLITRIIQVEFDTKAKAPLWEKFLDRIFDGNRQLIEFLQRAVGYSLTGSIKEQCMIILHGVGRNGKSTFLDTIRTMLGGYTRNANASTFMRTENQNLNEIARLQGARFVTTTELEEGERLSESLIKQATGGEPLTARYLYKEAFEYIPEFKLWMGTNHKPKITGGDLGIWRRIRLVPFNVIIPPEEQDPELPEKLLQELPGIFNWAMEGCRMWQKDGMKPPREVLTATDDYRGEMDAIQVFLDECVETKDGSSIRSGELYRVYENWCSQNGEYKHSNTKFALKLQEKGFLKSRTMIMRSWENIQFTSAGRRLLHTGSSEEKDDRGDAYEQVNFPWEK